VFLKRCNFTPDRAKSVMLWACFHFPQLALDAIHVDADRIDADPIDANARGKLPFAVIDGPLQRRHVVLANATARNAGVREGHAVAAAQTLCPRLITAPRDETAERVALESIAAWAYRFSAEVSIAAPDTVFLEVGASLALFGGWPAIERRLRNEIATFGFAYSLTAAPVATGARVLAAHSDGISSSPHSVSCRSSRAGSTGKPSPRCAGWDSARCLISSACRAPSSRAASARHRSIISIACAGLPPNRCCAIGRLRATNVAWNSRSVSNRTGRSHFRCNG
jgi:hypothetical protein